MYAFQMCFATLQTNLNLEKVDVMMRDSSPRHCLFGEVCWQRPSSRWPTAHGSHASKQAEEFNIPCLLAKVDATVLGPNWRDASVGYVNHYVMFHDQAKACQTGEQMAMVRWWIKPGTVRISPSKPGDWNGGYLIYSHFNRKYMEQWWWLINKLWEVPKSFKQILNLQRESMQEKHMWIPADTPAQFTMWNLTGLATHLLQKQNTSHPKILLHNPRESTTT